MLKVESSSRTPLPYLYVQNEDGSSSLIRSSVVEPGVWMMSMEMITRLGVVTKERTFPGRVMVCGEVPGQSGKGSEKVLRFIISHMVVRTARESSTLRFWARALLVLAGPVVVLAVDGAALVDATGAEVDGWEG